MTIRYVMTCIFDDEVRIIEGEIRCDDIRKSE